MPIQALRWSILVHVAVIAIAALVGLAPIPPTVIDRLYSSGAYAWLQPALTATSNLTPIACLDLLLIILATAWISYAWRDLARLPRTSAAVRIVMRTASGSAVAYLAFLAAWGLNYRRVPLVDALSFEPSRVSAESARRAAATAVERLNALHGAAHDALPTAGIDERLVDGLHRAVRDLGRGVAIRAARPKWTLLDAYFVRAGVDGMTDPYFLETLIASDVLPVERPFVVAHEWSHLAGFADEGDANFVGWLACERSTPAAQYSGWLFLYGQLAQAIGARDVAPIASRLAAGPRADLRAISDRYLQHVNPQVAAAGWRAYDTYLKANRVEAGMRSYSQVVRLVLGLTLPSGEPALAQ
jgi:uncharacterized protein DUF3810